MEFGLAILLIVIGMGLTYVILEVRGMKTDSEVDTDSLRDAFKGAAAEALQMNSDNFLKLAEEKLSGKMTEAQSGLDRETEEMKGLVEPIKELVKEYKKELSETQRNVSKDHSSLEALVKELKDGQVLLHKETGNLVTALRRPQVRGRWGEFTLKRVAELAGMVEHCDFEEQDTIITEEGRLRPDMTVHLPGGRILVVDAKTPLEAYLDAYKAEGEDEREDHLKRHAALMRKHVKDLSGKAYWDQFPDTPEYVVMFIPGEPFLQAAFMRDPDLLDDALQSKVLVTSPVSFVGLLNVVAHGWRQEAMAENAIQIQDLGQELLSRLIKFVDHFEKVGTRLNSAVKSYNESVGSLESRVLVSARKMKELGVQVSGTLNETNQIETAVREMKLPQDEGD
ncbi:DNA recombination protein RmuC [Candidatus Zixiibacteriota bacterium]